jgi:hypothetical protein
MVRNEDIPELDGIEDVPSPLPEQLEVTHLPTLKDVPERFQQMLVLRAMGFSYTSIGLQFGVSHVAVLKACRRYDPESKFNLTKDDRRAFLAQIFEARSVEAMLYLTPQKLANANPSTLAKAATAMAAMAERLDPTGTAAPKDRSDLNRWLERLRESRELPEDSSEEGDTS